MSVIIPVFDGERYLAAAIESALLQTVSPAEVVVIDDGSTDRSAAIAEGFGGTVRCVRQARAGIGAARNAGLVAARERLVAFLDADDLWEPGKTAGQRAALEADRRLDMVFGLAVQFHSPELSDEERARTRVPSAPAPGYVPGGGLFRREAFERAGAFETGWRVGEFVGWYQRAMELGLRSALVPEVVLRRRVHTTNQGIRARDSLIDYARILKASIDRRRAAGKPDPDGGEADARRET